MVPNGKNFSKEQSKGYSEFLGYMEQRHTASQTQPENQQTIINNLHFFVDEVRREYELQLGLRKIIEKKANTVITISGAILALFFGFTAYVNSSMTATDAALKVRPAEVIVIIGSVVAIVIAITIASLSLRLGRNFGVISLSSMFLRLDETANIPGIDYHSKEPETMPLTGILIRYSQSIAQTEKFNLRKASLIHFSQVSFLGGIVLLGASLILTYTKYLQI
jgi:hypothetical protein